MQAIAHTSLTASDLVPYLGPPHRNWFQPLVTNL